MSFFSAFTCGEMSKSNISIGMPMVVQAFGIYVVGVITRYSFPAIEH